MTHCTVCGAVAREGAKFCTSCGARLVDTMPAPAATAAPDDTVTAATTDEDAAVATAARDDDQPVAEPGWATTADNDAASEDETIPGEPVESAAPDDPAGAPGVETVEYASSWPSDEEPAAPEATDEPAGAAEPAAETSPWSSWSSATTEPPVDIAEPEPETAAPVDADAPVEERQHGASQWESWAPVASGGATVPANASEAATSARRLLDELAARIDRLAASAALAGPDVDAGALAGQLDRWSRPVHGTAELLEVVQAVRKAPRDLDAVTSLAYRAADLELLVRHYQSITAGAGEWSRRLRQEDATSSDEA